MGGATRPRRRASDPLWPRSYASPVEMRAPLPATGVAVAPRQRQIPGMHDTSAEAARVARDAIRRTDPIMRMRQALAHSEAMRSLALERLRMRHPDLPTIALVELLLGERLVPDGVGRPRP